MNERDHPLVTIGIPSYNYSRYIIGALDSVVKQTYENIEIVIVDDLSTDNSVSVIEDWIQRAGVTIPIRFIKNVKNGGLTKVCNQILENASGKYFQVLDADDVLLPHKIEEQVKLLEASENTAAIYSNVAVIDENGDLANIDYLSRIGYDQNKMPEGYLFEKLFHFNFIPLPSVLINAALAKEVGGFDESIHVQDYYLWLKLAKKYRIIYRQENTALYRVHSSSMSQSVLTNPRSTDSILRIKFHYYHLVNRQVKIIIRKNIYNSVPYLYKFNYPSAKEWIRRNVWLNPGFKSFGYYAAINIGIPYSFFDKIKSKFHASIEPNR